jgi:hypothetical protein
MVKGLSRRVVVVRFPDAKVFEQAIFIIREDAPHTGVSAGDVLQEAIQVADNYVSPRRRGRAPFAPYIAALWATGGAAVTGLAWLIAAVFG